jgi:hypothetical protein
MRGFFHIRFAQGQNDNLFLHVFAGPADRLLNRAEETDGKHEKCADEFERSSNNDSDEAEGQEDEPDERIEEKRREGEGPTDDHEDQKEQKVEHRCFSLLRD